MGWKESLKEWWYDDEINKRIDESPNIVGSKGVDPWGLNTERAKLGIVPLKWLYNHYFRVEAFGLENIPPKGRAFVIPNHSGQLPMDAMMLGCALVLNPNAPRVARGMIERFFPTVPYISTLLTSFGGIVGDPINCIKMLENEEIVIVFPEGARGTGKPYKHRYQLQRMGTGFVRVAIETGSPIIPVGIVGAEETMPSLGNIAPLAKLLGVPYIPIGPLLPLPTKMYIHFGKSIRLQGDLDNEQEMVERVEDVKKEINTLIQKGLEQRGTRIFR